MADPAPGAAYPRPPWRLVGHLWLSVFHLRRRADESHPPGTYGAAFVSYEPGSVLTYSELLVARLLTSRRVTVTDIWVDSPASRAGGRELWAIPKELCDFDLDTGHRGMLSTTHWTASRSRRPIASAWFTDVSRAAVRLPFRGAVCQPGIAETAGEERGSDLRGSARALPCRGHWDFAADGALGWLRGARQLGSLRMVDFTMAFG